MLKKFPSEVIYILNELEQAGFEAFVVGGAVRDLLRGSQPKDWDLATNAEPEEIQKVFPDTLYENRFGTVTVRIHHDHIPDGRLYESGVYELEVTTYRIEADYTNQRHPDTVSFTKNIQEDLARRDFTVNAMAMNKEEEIFDPFNGQSDLRSELIRAVNDPSERFQEDALRMIRAVRFAAQIGFDIEEETRRAIKENASLLGKVSAERIRDEFVKIIMAQESARGISYLAELGLLQVFLPELAEGIGVGQNKHHKYEVFEHHIRSLDYATRKEYSLAVRIASLFHDIGKPNVKRGKGEDATFYNHEVVGAKITRQILKRLKFPNDLLNKIVILVRNHQFYYTPEEVTASSVRRLIKNVGKDNIDELIQVREADRIGSGVPKAVPYKLRHLQYMIEQVQTDPVSVKMLAVSGDDLIKELHISPSPKLGLILNSLLAEVLEDPQKNTKEILLTRAADLLKSNEQELKDNLAKIAQAQQEQEEEIKKKYYVK